MKDANITWDAVADVNGYNVYLSTDGGAFEKQNTELITALEYTIEALDVGEYEVRVVAVRNDIESEGCSAVEFKVYESSLKSISYDSTTDHVEVADSASLDITEALTLMAWVYPTSFEDGFEVIMVKGKSHSTVSDSQRSAFELNTANGQIRFVIRDTGSNQSVTQLPETLPLNAWSHLAATWDGSSLKLYLNGESVTDVDTDITTLRTNSFDLILGYDVIRSDSRMVWKGELDELSIWNVALTAEQVKDRMLGLLTGNETGLAAYWNAEDEAAVLTDLSPNGNDGEINGVEYSDNTPF